MLRILLAVFIRCVLLCKSWLVLCVCGFSGELGRVMILCFCLLVRWVVISDLDCSVVFIISVVSDRLEMIWL